MSNHNILEYTAYREKNISYSMIQTDNIIQYDTFRHYHTLSWFGYQIIGFIVVSLSYSTDMQILPFGSSSQIYKLERVPKLHQDNCMPHEATAMMISQRGCHI